MTKTITSPPGIAVYPHLNRPDTRFDPDGPGHFKTGLKLDPSEKEHEEFIDYLRDLEENVALLAAIDETGKPASKLKKGNSVIKEEEDSDGKPTGMVIVNFKTKAGGVDKRTKEVWTKKLPIFDRYLKPLEDSVGGGSTIQVAFDPKPYFMPTNGYGITLYLNMVKVTELISYGASPEDVFEAEEEPSIEDCGMDPAEL